MLNIEQKKGDSELLDGRLTVYAIIDLDPSELASTRHPIASVVHNGLLVAQGNFKEQNNLKDFLQSEMGLSLEEGLEEIIERLDGLESALDPQKLREKIENMKEFEDFIPTPAKIVPFHSQEEVLEQEGDVFFVGSFKSIANANLSVNSFPIFYQARYREQQLQRVKFEIEILIAQIEKGETTSEEANYLDKHIDVGQKLLKEYFPNMLYNRKDPKVLDAAETQFKKFMQGYRYAEDIDEIVRIIDKPGELSSKHFKMLELYAKKIAEMHAENFSEVENVSRAIESLRKEL
jgi:hypothetical protein